MEPVLALIGIDPETVARLQPVLDQLGVAAEVVDTARAAVERMAARRFRLAVCRYPLPDLTMAELLRAIRRRGTPCRDTPLLVLTVPEMREEARQQVGFGPFQVGSLRDPVTVLHAALSQLLRLEPRRALDLPACLTVEAEGDRRQLEGRVVNVSLSGMLLDHVPLLPVTTRCWFELTLSGPPVRGTAEVVRHSRPARERVRGLAVRFLSFEPQARERLAARLAVAG